MANLTIPQPQYDLGQEVWLLFKGALIPSTIKVRAYDPDKADWYYRVALSGQWHTAKELGDRTREGQANV